MSNKNFAQYEYAYTDSSRNNKMDKNRKHAIDVALSRKAKLPRIHACQTLSIHKYDNYGLQYHDIRFSPDIQHTDVENLQIMYYNMYLQSARALDHNRKFIAKLCEIADGEDDLEDVSSLNFEYDKSLLSHSSGTLSNFYNIPMGENFETILIQVLEISKNIVENIKKKVYASTFERLGDKSKKDSIIINRILSKTDKLIADIQNKTLSLDNAKQAFESKQRTEKDIELKV